MKIRKKIRLYNVVSLVLLAIMILSFILVDTSLSFNKIKMMTGDSLKKIAESALKDKVDIAYRIALYHYNNDSIPEGERKKRAIDELSRLTFDNGAGYYFAYEKRNDDYYFAFHGANHTLTGTKVNIEETDIYGKKYRKELIENAGISNRMVEYYYKKPGTGQIQKKISYSRLMGNWNWVIVSGIYADEIEAVIAEQNKNTGLLLTRIVTGSSVIAITALAIMLFLTGKMGDRIIRPLLSVTSAMKEINRGTGDLTVRIESDTDDETAELSGSFNTFIEGIRLIVSDIMEAVSLLNRESAVMKDIAGRFSENSREQAASSEEISSSVEEVASGLELIFSSTGSQTDEISRLNSETAKFSESLRSLSLTMQETDKLSDMLKDNAENGQSALNEINDIITSLNENSNRMNDIVMIIKDISDKINLLALNAAIESARAGEAGRGFAVVADEITRLADETSGSIKNIESLIQNNTGSIIRASGSVKKTNDSFRIIYEEMKSLRELTVKASETMVTQVGINEQSLSSLNSVAEKSENIRTATEEHKLAMNEITSSISTVTIMAQTIAENSVRLSETAAEISLSAERLSGRTSSFRI